MNISSPLEKILQKLSSWVEALVAMIPNMGVALILLVMFFFLARVGRKVFVNIFSKTSDNETLVALFGKIFQYIIFGIGLFIILEVLQLGKAVTSLLAGVGVVGIALGFAFQDIAANFIAGIILAFRQPFRLHDIVEVEGIMGSVSRTNLRVTTILTFQGQEVYVPNKMMLQNPIINYTILGKRRIDLAVGISYGEDLAKVEDLVTDTIGKLDGVIDEDKLIFDYVAFGDSSINFNIRFWIAYPGDPGYLGMRNLAIKAIKETFDNNDIIIPFPIRTLDFKPDQIAEITEGNGQCSID